MTHPADSAPRADAAGAWSERPGGAGVWREDARSPRWTGVELVAMVLGFIVFWPIGLAILAWKFWQRRPGYPGDLKNFTDERIEGMRTLFREGCAARRQARRDWAAARWGFSQDASNPRAATGNRAFDEWKSAELARLEEERRKLDDAQREFGEYLAHLRQARDQEEFQRFVSERDASRQRGESGWRPFSQKPEGDRPL